MSKLTWNDLTDADRERAATCVHEAGHAVMAVLAGTRITECTVSGAEGVVRFDDQSYRTRAGIGWAGPYAELLFVHGGEPSPEARADAFAAASDEDRELMDGQMARRAESDVKFAMPAIRRLAATLYQHGSVRNLDVHLALGVRTGVDIDTVRWAHRQRIAVESLRPAGVA